MLVLVMDEDHVPAPITHIRRVSWGGFEFVASLCIVFCRLEGGEVSGGSSVDCGVVSISLFELSIS